MLLSVPMIIHLSVLFIAFDHFTYSQATTFEKACALGGTGCGKSQTCINNLCQCDPGQRRFWVGEKLGCVICPTGYVRQPKRCYKYFDANKNHSEARASCRQQQADLFTWRDNSDESELITALTQASGHSNQQSVKRQHYTWSGGIVHHGDGTRANYKITWVDPLGPTIPHPEVNDRYSDRYCIRATVYNYDGDPEPTRQTKNGEKENCVSIIFVPEVNSLGQVCMADDYCSTKLTYICELTATTIAQNNQLPTLEIVTQKNPPAPLIDYKDPVIDQGKADEEIDSPSALGEKSESSNTLIYMIVGGVLIAIIGIGAFIFIRKRNQNNQMMNVSPTNSMASSVVSGADYI